MTKRKLFKKFLKEKELTERAKDILHTAWNQSLDEHILMTPEEMLVSAIGKWDSLKEGVYYWRKIDLEWKTYLKNSGKLGKD